MGSESNTSLSNPLTLTVLSYSALLFRAFQTITPCPCCTKISEPSGNRRLTYPVNSGMPNHRRSYGSGPYVSFVHLRINKLQGRVAIDPPQPVPNKQNNYPSLCVGRVFIIDAKRYYCGRDPARKHDVTLVYSTYPALTGFKRGRCAYRLKALVATRCLSCM